MQDNPAFNDPSRTLSENRLAIPNPEIPTCKTSLGKLDLPPLYKVIQLHTP